MNDYKKLIATLRYYADTADENIYGLCANSPKTMTQAADAIERLTKEGEYIPTDTLKKYHAWLLEEYHKNPTSENLHSIDMAISWLKAYAKYKCVNVEFCD